MGDLAKPGSGNRDQDSCSARSDVRWEQ